MVKKRLIVILVLLFPVPMLAWSQVALNSFALAASAAVKTEVVVVVHSSNTAEIDKKTISKIFLGKAKSFPGGGNATPFGLEDGSGTTEEFNAVVLNKKTAQLKSYWSKLVFTGKGTPPQQLETDAEVIDMVTNTPDAIGFVSSVDGISGVRIIGKFERAIE